MSWSGRDALEDLREWSGGHPGCPGVVYRLAQMFMSGREAYGDLWEWSGG